jgi:hypothetical protein
MQAAYNLIKKHFPRQLRTIPGHGPGTLAIRLSDGLREAHNNNVKVVKQHLATIYNIDGLQKNKASWGLNHPQTAELLRPMNIELNSPEWFVPSLILILLTDSS